MATIREVARAAGVSTATVSNVLNGRNDRVSDATVAKVLATVRALKYRPTPLEHNQKAIRTKNIGFIVPDMTAEMFRHGGYAQEVLHGVLEGAASRGYSLTIFIEKIWDDVGLAIRRSYDGRCDGIIVVAPQPGNEAIEMLYARGTPITTVGSTPWMPNVSSVDVDNLVIGAMAARHLYELGHRRMAFVVNSKPQISALERRDGFLREAASLGLGRDAVVIQPPTGQSGDPADYVVHALTTKDAPTAAFFWHDGMAAATIVRLRERGFDVPDWLSVVSVDDAPEAREFGLTTFKNPTYEIGKRAARVLIDRIENPEEVTETTRFAPEKVCRTSTAAPR